MVYQDLVDFARGALAMGYGEKEIIEALEAAGWRPDDVREALKVASGLGPKEFTKAQIEAGDFNAERKLAEEKRRRAEEEESLVGVVKAGGEESRHFPTLAAWFTCITNPAITFRRARYHPGYLKAAVGFGIPPVVFALMLFLLAVLGAPQFLYNAGFLADLRGDEILALSRELTSGGIILPLSLLFGIFVSSVISGYAKSVIPHAVARALGGKGTFKQLSYNMSIAFAGATALLVPATPFALAAIVGFSSGAPPSITTIAAALVASALAVHALIVLPVFAVRETHLISTARAAVAVWALPMLGLLVLAATAPIT